VEADLGDGVWTLLDPTPAAGRGESRGNRVWRKLVDLYDRADNRWIKSVVYFDLSDQRRILSAISALFSEEISLPFSNVLKSMPVLWIVAFGLGVALVVLLIGKRTLRGRDNPPHVYLTTMRALVRKGLLSDVHPWHEVNRDEILARSPETRSVLQQFMDRYYQVRFGTNGRDAEQQLQVAKRELLQSAAHVKAARG
jgi:hypothetical protein